MEKEKSKVKKDLSTYFDTKARWKEMQTNYGYKIKELIGEGSFGQVYKC